MKGLPSNGCFKIKHFLALIFSLSLSTTIYADPFIDSVADVQYGWGAGFGQSELPDIILGPPRGSGETGGSLDVLSLGDGGVITLEFTDNLALNGPGPDLIIFENAFFIAGNPENVYVEAAFVEVSQDGINFVRFPNDYDPEGEPPNHADNWTGFSGVQPVFSNPENDIDPTDPDVAGGDLFDLDALQEKGVFFEGIKYVRIIDTDEPPNAAYDDDGDEIYDPGTPTYGKSGYDLDAIAAVHSLEIEDPIPTPTPTIFPEPTFTPQMPAATPTPIPFNVELNLNKNRFESNDPFLLSINIQNSDQQQRIRCFIVLELSGEFWFWPNWETETDWREIEMEPEETWSRIILEFQWPETDFQNYTALIWAGCLTTDNILLDDPAFCAFEF